MATMRNPLDDEENQNNLENGMIGTGGGTGAAGSQAQGTGWTNLQQYLDTNKGAGNAIADTALKSTGDDIQKSKDAINSWADSAKQKVNSNTLQDTWSDQIKNSSTADLGKIDQNAFNAWKNLGSYWGAQDASADQGYGDAYRTYGSTKDKIDNANTFEGQQSLLKNAYGKDGQRYTGGMGLLDTFVARGDAGQKFDDFKSQNANYGDSWNSAVGGVNDSIAQARNKGDQTQQNVMDAISQRIASLNSDVDARAKGEQAKAIDSAATQAKNAARDGGAWGILNDDFSQFVVPGATKTSDYYDDIDLAALNSLAGMDSDPLTGGYARTQAAAPTIDQTKLDEYIKAHPKPTGAIGPVDRPVDRPIDRAPRGGSGGAEVGGQSAADQDASLDKLLKQIQSRRG